MKKAILFLAASSILAACAIGCGDSSSDPEQTGSAGSDSGSGGEAGTAGSAGSAGSSGSAGQAGSGGSGGSAGDGGTNICSPNPCDTTANQAAHKTRCTPEAPDAGGGYKCTCDSANGYYDDGGLCCQAHSSNIGGKCVCQTGWIDPENKGVCLSACNEDSFEGLTGWCADNKLCVQGICQTNGCLNMTCPAKASCVSKNGAGFCQCSSGLHMDKSLCCGAHASNVSNVCACDTGYHDVSGSCVADTTNKCAKSNPCSELHKNVCVPDSSSQGYHCNCNENYQPATTGTACELTTLTTCAAGFSCDNNYCASTNKSLDQCVSDADCKVYNPTANTTCNPLAAGGICLNCTAPEDCPGNMQCTTFNTCASLCSSDNECPYGVCSGTGYCVQKKCNSNADCFAGTICNNPSNDVSGGMCQRPPCKSTECGSSNPNGTCPNANESCIAGKCVSACSPNPCTGINQNACTIVGGKPTCSCAAGTSLDSTGKCAPTTVSKCPTGFTCQSGRCSDSTVTNFQCGASSDCGTPMNCSNALPSGTCYGCAAGFKCPTGASCVADYCITSCTKESDCATGMICNGGKCGKKTCASPSDCPANYTCSVSGSCYRIPCQ